MEEAPAATSVSEEISEIPKKPPRGWLKILGFTLLGLIIANGILAAGYLTALKTQPTKVTPFPTPTPRPISQVAPTSTPTPDPTADWKTYRNQEHAFELKYPPDWELMNRLSDPALPTLEFGKVGPTQTSQFDFLDGAFLKFFPSRRQSDEEILSTLKSYGEPKLFEHLGWRGFRSRSKLEDGAQLDAISGSKKTPSGKTVQFFWLHFNPSNNGLEAEKYLFPILSTFKFLG